MRSGKLLRSWLSSIILTKIVYVKSAIYYYFLLYNVANTSSLILQDDPSAHDKFVRLTTAYETLKDNDLRKKYDLYGEDGLTNSHKTQTYHSWSYYQNSFIYDDDEYVINLERNDYCEYIIFSAFNFLHMKQNVLISVC